MLYSLLVTMSSTDQETKKPYNWHERRRIGESTQPWTRKCRTNQIRSMVYRNSMHITERNENNKQTPFVI